VVIDYRKTKIEVLGLIATHLGRVMILPPILAEVDDFEREDCQSLGLEIVSPTLEEYAEAALHKEPGLSAEDYLCLVVSERLTATCLTNDGALHKACRRKSIKCMCGLRPMLHLTEMKILSPRDAWRTAQAIFASNIYITDTVIEDFRRNLNRIAAAKTAEADRKLRKKPSEPRR